MICKIKLSGVAIGFVGILIAFLNLRACFADPGKTAFAEVVMNSVEEISRDTPGFERFMADFPPPQGVDPSSVTAIGDKAMRWNTSPAESLGVVYIAQGERTRVVARLDEIRDWARDTVYAWVSWVVAAVGWAIYATVERVEFRRERAA